MRKLGRMIAEEMAAKIDYKGKVLVMEGVPGQATSDVRTKAAMDVFASSPDITVESGVPPGRPMKAVSLQRTTSPSGAMNSRRS